jgi:hypothetical protein
MTVDRIAMVFSLVGTAFKGLVVLLWRLWRFPQLLALATTYDPGGVWFADKLIVLFFDQRRLAPTTAEAVTYEVLLVVGFGIECLLVGAIVGWIARLSSRRRSPEDEGKNFGRA